jgi:hypothetical protein
VNPAGIVGHVVGHSPEYYAARDAAGISVGRPYVKPAEFTGDYGSSVPLDIETGGVLYEPLTEISISVPAQVGIPSFPRAGLKIGKQKPSGVRPVKRTKPRQAAYALDLSPPDKELPWHSWSREALRRRYGEGVDADRTIAVRMKRLASLTVEKYGPQFLRFVRYAKSIGKAFLPAEGATVEMWLVNDLANTVNADNIDTYIRPINTAHDENLLPKPALGSHIGSVLDGLKQNQFSLKVASEARLWVPADAVASVLDFGLSMDVQLDMPESVSMLRACTAVVVDFVHFSRGDSGSRVRPGELIVDGGALFLKQFKLKGKQNRAAIARQQRDNSKVKVLSLPADAAPDVVRLVEKYLAVRAQLQQLDSRVSDECDSVYRLPWDAPAKFTTGTMNTFMTVAFLGAGVQAPPGFKYTWHMLRHGAASAAAALEVSERRIKDFGNWSRRSDAYETYVHTVPATTSGQRFFGWMKPAWALAHPGNVVLPVPELL